MLSAGTLTPDDLRALATAASLVSGAVKRDPQRSAHLRGLAGRLLRYAEAGCGVMVLPVMTTEPAEPVVDERFARWVETLEHFGKEGA